MGQTNVITLGGVTEEVTQTSDVGGLLPLSIKHVATGAGYEDLYVQVITIKDTYQPTFKQEMVYGRMDPIATYQNTVRKVQLSFKLDKDLHGVRDQDPEKQETNASLNAEDLQTIVNDIIKMMYPVYTTSDRGTNISASPLLRIKLGQFLYNSARPNLGVLCIPESINIEHTMIGAEGKADFDIGGALGYAFPGSYVLTLGLVVMHEDGKVGFAYENNGMKFGMGGSFPWDAGSFIMTTAGSAPEPSAQVLDMRTLTDSQRTYLQATKARVLRGAAMIKKHASKKKP